MTARIKYYMKTRKQRFATILGILIFLQVIDNFLKIFGSRSERSFKNYKILLIHYLYPEAVLEKTAKYSNYSPKHLSEASEKILGEKFVYLDRKFKNGLTRQMIADCLRNCGKIENEQEFINKGKYLDENKNRQSSLLLKEFYDVIEQSISIDKTTNATDELLMVDLLIKQMNDLERQYT